MVPKYIIYKKIRKCRRNLFSQKLQILKWHHNHSQSPVLGLAGLYPTGSEISCFWYIKTRGRKIAIEHVFAILISTSWRFYQAHKKICNIHLKEIFLKKVSNINFNMLLKQVFYELQISKCYSAMHLFWSILVTITSLFTFSDCPFSSW